MILQLRTEKYYSIEMTEEQVKDLLLVFDGLGEKEIGEAISCILGESFIAPRRQHIHETVQTFRLALAEYQKL